MELRRFLNVGLLRLAFSSPPWFVIPTVRSCSSGTGVLVVVCIHYLILKTQPQVIIELPFCQNPVLLELGGLCGEKGNAEGCERDFSGSVDTRYTVGFALVAIHLGHCGNLSPNMGKRLFDCSFVASS
jgi:hypothetical protein